jgi:hypothetical protein
MADHDGYCACPLLRAAAEVERLAQIGMKLDGYDAARHLVVAALREKYGCRGPRKVALCPWSAAVPYGRSVSTDDQGVPEVKRNRTPGKDTGEYL